MDAPPRIIALKCANCGAGLDIGPDTDRFACMYCGTQQEVQRSGGIVSLRLLGNAIARVQEGTDRTAAELAIRRLREDMVVLQRQDELLQQQLSALISNQRVQIGNEFESRLDIVGALLRVFAGVMAFFVGLAEVGFIERLHMGAEKGNPIPLAICSVAFLILVGGPLLFLKGRARVKRLELSLRMGEKTPQQATIEEAIHKNQEHIQSVAAEMQQNLALLKRGP